MTKFNEEKIWELYESNLNQSMASLAKIEVCCGEKPAFAGLNGWVFEQTIQHCVQKELLANGLKIKIEGQYHLGGRVKADLKIGNVAIEIKSGGLFGEDDVLKYKKYRTMAERQKLQYLFLSMGETAASNREGIIKALGKQNVFLLCDEKDEWSSGEWERFVARLLALLGESR